MKKINNSNGFSLVQVLISMALAGGLAVFLLRLGTNQSRLQKKAVEDLDLNQFYQHLQKIFLDSNACKNTLAAATGLNSTNDQSQITSIKDKDGNIIYDLNDKRPAPSLKISSLLVQRNIGSNAKLIIKIKKNNKEKSFGPEELERKIDVIASYSGGKIIKCYSQLDNAVLTAKKEVCLDLCSKTPGVPGDETKCWDSSTNSCLVGSKGVTIYQNQETHEITMKQFTSTERSCSKCKKECNPCDPGESMINRNCSLGKNCGFHKWRNCTATCTNPNGNTPLGKLMFFDAN